jgi:two-component system phosphate regulon sensor histidine kinase PhoR
VLDTDLKILSDFKKHFLSSLIFIKELALINVVFIAAAFFIFSSTEKFLIFISVLLIVNIYSMYLIGRRRNRELDEIKAIINNIRKNKYQTEEEIELDRHLLALQKAIKKMFIKTKNDIDYLQRLQKMRSQFLANVSHELRTPIFAIQGYIETLLNGAVNDKDVNLHFLGKANQHTINLSNLLSDLIDISMIESGEMRMNYGYFKVNVLFKKIIAEQKHLAEEKNIKLNFNQADDDLSLFGDKDKIKQVLVNLVQNAVKYTETGSVEVSIEENKKTATIIVKDTGIGIPEKYLDRIFERFYRVDKARSKSVGGTGLGLAIVKHIVEAHGSKVVVKSIIDDGSEFSFQLKK